MLSSSFSDFAQAISPIAGLPAVALVVLASILLIVVSSWRGFLLAFAGLYVVLALASTRLLPVEWAFLRLLVGGVVSLIWYIAFQQGLSRRILPSVRLLGQLRHWRPALHMPSAVGFGRHRHALHSINPEPAPNQFAMNSVFRLTLIGLVGLVLFLSRVTIALPGLSSELNFVCLWLILMGALALGLDDDPLRSGVGLLLWLAAAQLFFSSLTRDARLIGVFGVLEILVGLSTSYLASVQNRRGVMAFDREESEQ